MNAAWEWPGLLPWRPGALAGRPGGGADESAYLEELVSLASESAERAEDASRQAAKAGVRLRRSRLAFAAFGIVGLAIGVAGAAGSLWNATQRQQQIAQELTTVKTLQKQADVRLAAVVSAEEQAARPVVQTASAPLPHLKAIPVAVLPRWSVQPVSQPERQDPPPQPVRYRRPPERRYVMVAPPVILARFMVNIQRDIGSLFR
ncbi:MAG TPA: hypothetical protein VGG99_04420 [Acetobacteraceae bacterium]